MLVKFLLEWSETNYTHTGLPRPFARYKKGNIKNLATKTPIPWQSYPDVETSKIRMIDKHEDLVWVEGRCAFCGIIFKKGENAIRWVTLEQMPTKRTLKVFSDYHPFHPECMRQTRIFCPYMRTLSDKEFENGQFSKLKENAKNQISMFNLPL